MKTMKLFVVLIVVAVASLLSVPMATAAPEGPQSVLTYTAPAKVKVDKETFDCEIASHKFDKATGVGTITFNGQLKEIRGSSFFNSAITNIVIPNSVTSIGEGVFECCSNLTSITIPNSVTSIGRWAFQNCSSLTSITIGNSVTSIDNWAFKGCSSLKSITIPNSVTSIGKGAFLGCSSLTSITIPNRVTSIGEEAFSYFSSLTDITIGNSVTLIGYDAFSGCYIQSVIIDTVTGDTSYIEDLFVDNIWFRDSKIAGYTGKYASEDGRCLIVDGKLIDIVEHDLTTYTIPDGVVEIGGGAFEGCSSLTSITIPNSVTSIEWSAFSGCDALKDVNVNITNLAEYCKGNTICNIPGSKHLYINNKEIT
ncbi:MAG: leucine-rich repeat protein, partial [Alistipes sp.]|nr:leucine-rich repeat protein [Alistipes sp.]